MGSTARVRRRAGQSLMRGAQARDRIFDLGALALEMPDLADDLIGLQLFLEFRVDARAAVADQFADFAEREAQLLALEDHLQAKPVDRRVKSRGPFAPRLEHPLVFIKSQRSQGDAEFAGHLSYGEFRAVVAAIGFFRSGHW